MRIGLFNELDQHADYLWNQCEHGQGHHFELELARWDRTADKALIVNWPSPPGGTRRAGGWRRTLYKLARRSTTPLRMRYGYEWLQRERQAGTQGTAVLFYEPPALIPDDWWAVARRHAGRIYAPDARATHPISLPAMWTIERDVHELRAMPPPEKPLPLAAISSGKPPGKSLIAGHDARLNFYRILRREGVPLGLFGRGLPGDLAARGPVACKGNVLRPARCALVIENFAEGDMYVTEKLWDALLCWSLPLYYGSSAAERLIPADAIVRLPDLGARGVETVKAALADRDLWTRRVDAIAEARRRALGDLRLLEWLRREAPAW